MSKNANAMVTNKLTYKFPVSSTVEGEDNRPISATSAYAMFGVEMVKTIKGDSKTIQSLARETIRILSRLRNTDPLPNGSRTFRIMRHNHLAGAKYINNQEHKKKQKD